MIPHARWPCAQVQTNTNLDCTTAAALHQIAEVSWLNASSNEWSYIGVV